MAVLNIVTFAWVRERLGQGEYVLDFPDLADLTVRDVLDRLAQAQPEAEFLIPDTARLRFALDQHMVEADQPIGQSRELAIFPPVTGG